MQLSKTKLSRVRRGRVIRTPHWMFCPDGCAVFCAEGAPQSCVQLTAKQIEQLRINTVNHRKQTIASLASAIVSDPFSNVS